MDFFGEENVLTRDGCPIHYWISGREDAPWVILFHGGQVDHSMFAEQLPVLTSRFRVLAFDARGHGASQPLAGELSYTGLAEDGLALLDQVGAERAIFIGHSMGGCAAQEAAFRHPERVLALALIGSLCVAEKIPDPMRKLSRMLGLMIFLLPEKNLQKFMLGAADSFSIVPQVKETIRTGTLKISKPTFRQINNMVLNGYHAEPGYHISYPLLLTCGDHDASLIRRQVGAWAQREAGSRFEEVPEAGHNANQDNPPEFNRILDEFLTELCPA